MTNPIYKLIAEKTRKEWAANDEKRDKDYSIPESVSVTEGIFYGPAGKFNTLNVYTPKAAEGLLPVIVCFHGGGFFYGSTKQYQFYCADLAARGFAVICFNYRLAPEHQFPAAIEDCNLAFSWVCRNGEEMGFDLNRIYFAGDSAGAHLVENYTAILTNPDFAKLYDFSVPAVKPKAVALNSGLMDFSLIQDKGSALTIKSYIGWKNKKKIRQLKIKENITKEFPPVFIMTAPNDFLHYMAEPQAEFFKSRGIEAVVKSYGTPEMPEACHVFHINLKLEIAKQCNDDECAFFMEHK